MLGGIFELSDKRKVYMAYRNHSDIYLGDRVIDPVTGNVTYPHMGWSIDNDTRIEMRLEGVYTFAVWVRDTGEIYLAQREDWDGPKSRVCNWEGHVGKKGKGGAAQRCLPFKTDGVSNYRMKTGTHVIGSTARRAA